MDSSEMYKCSHCKKSFFQQRYLNAHIKRVHNIKFQSDVSQELYKCEICDKTFSSKNSESKHRIRSHALYKKKLNVECQEEGCNESFSNQQEFRMHLKLQHGYDNIDYCEEKKFKSEEDFNEWLAGEENENKVHFILAKGKESRKDCSVITYTCHRNGKYKCRSTGKRQLKAQGTKKMNSTCCAQIIVKIFPDHVEAAYYKEHYKHDFLLGHLPLSSKVKDTVAGKLLSGVSDNRIIDDIRNIVCDGEEDRHHLITKKDLNNIKARIGRQLPSNGSIISNDVLSVRALVTEMTENGDSILCYKEQGNGHSVLEEKDFMFAFMTPLQKRMFANFGSDRICIDSTHGTTGYGFELTTVMVVDEYEEGFPIAFCLSSTVNFIIMKYFFQCMKKVVNVNTKVFMSDDAPFFYNAWNEIFGPAEYRLLCAWHIDRAWQGHLNTIPKEKKDKVYKTLKTLMYELNPKIFHQMLSLFLEELSVDTDTKEFYEYFKNYYCGRTNMWAYCFRKGVKLNTNMHVEHFHREIKHIYLNGKKSKCVDKCCEQLRKYILDKKYARLTKLHKGKITKKHTVCFVRHKEGMKCVSRVKKISEGKWLVQSTSLKTQHEILKIHECNSKCKILCRFCYCCLKSYSCTCHDFQILNNVCKHIHAVGINNAKKNYTGPLNCNEQNKNINMFQRSPILQKSSIKPKNVQSKRDEILKQLSEIQGKTLLKTEIPEPIANEVLTALKSVNRLLDLHSKNIIPSTGMSEEPVNKNITLQKRFFNIKKQKSKKQRPSKPNAIESSNIKSILSGQLYVSNNPLNDHIY